MIYAILRSGETWRPAQGGADPGTSQEGRGDVPEGPEERATDQAGSGRLRDGDDRKGHHRSGDLNQ